MLDNTHRKDVFINGMRWHEIDMHLERFYLRKALPLVEKSGGTNSVDSTVVSSSASSATKSSNKKRFLHPCVKFNTREGCTYKDHCRFPHICAERGCMGAHPVFDHAAKGFRSNSGGKSDGT